MCAIIGRSTLTAGPEKAEKRSPDDIQGRNLHDNRVCPAPGKVVSVRAMVCRGTL